MCLLAALLPFCLCVAVAFRTCPSSCRSAPTFRGLVLVHLQKALCAPPNVRVPRPGFPPTMHERRQTSGNVGGFAVDEERGQMYSSRFVCVIRWRSLFVPCPPPRPPWRVSFLSLPFFVERHRRSGRSEWPSPAELVELGTRVVIASSEVSSLVFSTDTEAVEVCACVRACCVCRRERERARECVRLRVCVKWLARIVLVGGDDAGQPAYRYP